MEKALNPVRADAAQAAPAAAREAQRPPLAVDLDGTLIRTDLFWEGMAAAITQAPWIILIAPFVLFFGGRPLLKRLLIERNLVDFSTLPLNTDFAAWLGEEKARGRKLYLVSASDRRGVEAMAARVGLFDDVMGTQGRVNLKGRAKLKALQERFPDGFAYAGDSPADVPVWSGAASSVVVGRRQYLARRLEAQGRAVEATFPVPRPTLRTWVRALRLHQWAKNLLIFAALPLTHRYDDPQAWLACALGFFIVGVVASSSYILNDLSDLAADRAHWSKHARPFASGALSIAWGMGIAPAGLIGGLASAFFLSPPFGVEVACYVVLTLAYSFGVKRIAMVDTLTLATLFTLRLLMGLALVAAPATPWLLGFSMMLFLSLSLAKRHSEILRKQAAGGGSLAGRGYQADDAGLTLVAGVSTAVAACLILMLCVAEDAFTTPFANPVWLWVLPLIIYLWTMRIWLFAHRGEMNDDPVLFAVKDPPSLAMGVIATAIFALASIQF